MVRPIYYLFHSKFKKKYINLFNLFLLFFSHLAHFGQWAYGPHHGFAMTCRWNVEKHPEPLDNGDIEALFSLVDNPITKQMWNYR